jgi:hypothetical protein
MNAERQKGASHHGDGRGRNPWRNPDLLAELERLDAWIRRRLRSARLKQRKGGKSVTEFLRRLGVPPYRAARIGGSGKGWWRLAKRPPVNQALSNEWFSTQGLVSLALKYAELRAKDAAVYV